MCGAYFLEFRGRNLVCFVIAYNFNGKFAPEAGKTRMCTAFFTRATVIGILVPRAYDPSGLRQESRALGATISGMRHR